MRKAALLLLLGVTATAAHAGLFDDAEARQQIQTMRNETNARLDRIESSNSSAQQGLSNDIESLKQEIAKLRGQLEVMTNDLDQAQKRQRDFYVDLDTRLRKLESVAVAQSQPAAPEADPANETRDYEAALNQLKAGQNKEAAAAFQSFITAYPKSSFLPSAHFWAASALYQAKDLPGASKLFTKVAESWPDDARAPDALLGLSNCQAELGDKKGSRATLQTIVSKYPSSPAAQTAKQRLAKK